MFVPWHRVCLLRGAVGARSGPVGGQIISRERERRGCNRHIFNRFLWARCSVRQVRASRRQIISRERQRRGCNRRIFKDSFRLGASAALGGRRRMHYLLFWRGMDARGRFPLPLFPCTLTPLSRCCSCYQTHHFPDSATRQVLVCQYRDETIPAPRVIPGKRII